MTKRDHRKRHVELHQALDELLADWAFHNSKPGARNPKLFSNTTIQELLEWSHQQTIKPAERKKHEH